MKKYIKTNQAIYSEIKEIADDVFRSEDCEVKWWIVPDLATCYLTKFKGDESVVKNGRPAIYGYNGQLYKGQYLPFSISDENRIAKYDSEQLHEVISKMVHDFIDKFEEQLQFFKVVIDRLPEVVAKGDELISYLTDYYRNKGVSSVKVDGELCDIGLRYPRLTDKNVSLLPKLEFFVYLGKSYFSQIIPFSQLVNNEAADLIISKIDKESNFSNSSIISILKENRIDVTRAKYEIQLDRSDRYEDSRMYTKTFTCPGDYLAYFSMCLHSAPTARNLKEYFGDLSEFENIIKEYPDLLAIKKLATNSWQGDTDDYVVYLKNLSTERYLYQSNYDYYEENMWED